MIPVKSFYCNSKSVTRKYTILRETLDHAHSHYTRNIVILPSDSGNTALDSDIEDNPEDLVDQGDQEERSSKQKKIFNTHAKVE